MSYRGSGYGRGDGDDEPSLMKGPAGPPLIVFIGLAVGLGLLGLIIVVISGVVRGPEDSNNDSGATTQETAGLTTESELQPTGQGGVDSVQDATIEAQATIGAEQPTSEMTSESGAVAPAPTTEATPSVEGGEQRTPAAAQEMTSAATTAEATSEATTQATGEATTEANAGGAAASGGDETQIDIAADGLALAYTKQELSVPANSEVTLTFNNKSEILQHNWVLVNGDQDVAEKVDEDAVANRPSYAPSQGNKDAIAYTETLNGGQSGKVTFTAPGPGEYYFICTFPGHYAGGMYGVLTVK